MHLIQIGGHRFYCLVVFDGVEQSTTLHSKKLTLIFRVSLIEKLLILTKCWLDEHFWDSFR